MVLSKAPTVPHGRIAIIGLLPDFSNVSLTRSKIIEICDVLLDTVDLIDIAFLVVVSFLTVPIARFIHGYWFADHYKTKEADDTKQENDHVVDPFKQTYTFHAAESLSQIAMIAMIVYIIDLFVIVVYLQGIEFALAENIDFGTMASRILYTTWFGFRCMRFKRYLLGRVVNKSPEKLGKALVYDRFLDWIIYAILAFSIMDTLNIQVGAGLKSVFALSGVGTLVLSLASKDMASLFVSGVALSTSEKFRTGDLIKLGDNTTGVVQRMGLLFTEVRGGDEIITKIPNTQLANQRVSNLSRMSKCAVKQTLRFPYSSLSKLPQVLESIKEEIQASCPELIADGSRPFRANMNSFKEDHIEVEVDSRFDLPPIGPKYCDNRQRVLEAISRAVTKHEVEFAIPRYHIVGAISNDCS
jgi:small-conductance mechanosensitive channel